MSIIQLRRYQRKDADLDAVAASGIANAWTPYTPTVTAASGTFTTASATGKYLIVGKLTFVSVFVTITTNGTAAGYVAASLPNSPKSLQVITGREDAATGKMLLGKLVPSFPLIIYFYDGTYPGGSGYQLAVSGSYEAT